MTGRAQAVVIIGEARSSHRMVEMMMMMIMLIVMMLMKNNEECSDYPRLNAWTLKLNTWLRAADRLLYAYGWQAQ